MSVHLRKVFGRVEQDALFSALREQGVAEGYVWLLRTLYHHQTGHLRDGSSFRIARGVRQSDVLSPVLYNAALENALREWKRYTERTRLCAFA